MMLRNNQPLLFSQVITSYLCGYIFISHVRLFEFNYQIEEYMEKEEEKADNMCDVKKVLLDIHVSLRICQQN